jgi:hypothetical protein
MIIHQSLSASGPVDLNYNEGDTVYIACNATAGAIALQLPNANQARGVLFLIKKIDSSGNAVTITPVSGETIEGAATAALTAQYQSLMFVSTGTMWVYASGAQTEQRVNHDGTGTVSIGPGAKTGLDYSLIIGEDTAKGATATNLFAFGYRCAGYLGAGATGTKNMILGRIAASYLTSGYNNYVAGDNCAYYLSTGHDNFIMGVNAAGNFESGNYCVIIGTNAAGSANSSQGLVAIGNTSLNAETASSVIGIGYQAAYLKRGGNNGVFIGYNVCEGTGLWAGSATTVIGDQACGNITSGSGHDYDTIVGYQAFYNLAGSGNVGLGVYSGYYETGSNKLFIDNAKRASEADARVKALMYGVFAATTAAQKLSINAECYVLEKLGVGNTAPGWQIEATGDIVAKGGGGTGAGNYLGLFKSTGSLPGSASDSLPTLKTDYSTMYFSANGKYTGYLGGADAIFAIKNTSAVDKVVLNTNGDSHFSGGNVGIGTTVPTAKLSVSEKSAMNADGGFMIKLTNRTGGNSVKGEVVETSSSYDNAVQKIVKDVPDPIGVFYESGIADGSEAWIVVSGIADVYFVGNTTRNHLARGFLTADGASYVTGQALSEAVPTSPFANDKHFYEIGHLLESRTGAGLAKCVLHFN